MTNFIPGDGLVFRPPTFDEFNFQVDSQVGYIDVAGSTSTATVKDAVVRTTSTDYSDPYYDLGIVGADDVSLSAIDATGSLSGNRLSRVDDGECRVVASHPWLSRSVTLDMSRINNNVYSELDSYASGSLARHIDDSVKSMIGSHTSVDMPIYSVQNHATLSYVRNANCWAVSLNMSAVSPYNSRGASLRAGTAITPRHILLANHYPLGIGDTVRFIALDNTVVLRTVESIYSVPEPSQNAYDIQIAKLSSDLPVSITPAKFLPANAYDYLPSWKQWKIPLLYTNQQEQVVCGLANAVDNPVVDSIRVWTTTESPYATMYTKVLIGDSGSPVFAAINNELVLVTHWTSFGVGNAHHLLLTEIASAITTLGGGHSLSTVDLSAFTNYGA